MSVHPGLAALAGLVLLGQVPAVHEWIGMAMIVLANVAAVTMADRTPVDEPVPVLEPVA
jgi:inner membrane transporter RhtA